MLDSQVVSPNCSAARKNLAVTLHRITILLLSCSVLAIAVSCGAASNSKQSPAPAPGSPQIQVAVSPGTITLSPAAQQQFTATVQGTSNSAVTWTTSAGSISTSGVFTAPAVASNGAQIIITATSVIDPTQHASGTVNIQNPSKLSITTSSLTGAIINAPYNAGLAASGGTPPYQWTISGGSLPSGILLQATTGALAGTTSQPGDYSFTARVTDAKANAATQSLTLAVSSAISNFDGPAELPRVYLSTTLADTPAPGSTITVPAGGDLQAALNNAGCGDTIEIQSGATFAAGKYTLPAKACDDRHWVIVRTSASDASLPPEGKRMTPCYAGVASLVGRPAFACHSPQKVVATILYSGTGDGPIVFANGANHYRLLGLEITRAANDGKSVSTLVSRETNGATTHIVLDRLYIHGTPKDETRRGVGLSGGTSMAVQDSYISDIHCNAEGTCVDSQAVSGGVGDLPMGPYKITDNFLEASGENILLGGGEATQTPADIEIRLNHFFKPMFWLHGQPGFTAPAFIVKNHFELKNAQRVLFDSNVLEDNWGGFTQHGYSILLTPKNQDAGGVSVCPLCQVTDVTIRYVTISHVGGGFVIGNGSSASGGVALAGERYSIHDVIVDDIDGTLYAGRGTFAQVGTVAQPLLQDVTINHVTAFPNNTLLNVGAPVPATIPEFTFANSIVAAGDSPVTSTGPYGTVQNCAAYYPSPLIVWNRCFSDSKFSFNAILGATDSPSDWPAGNFLYSTSSIDFVNYHNGNGGDYHLLPSSPAISAASDGTNLGANVDAVLGAVSGVE